MLVPLYWTGEGSWAPNRTVALPTPLHTLAGVHGISTVVPPLATAHATDSAQWLGCSTHGAGTMCKEGPA
jgi:hypothetical protein